MDQAKENLIKGVIERCKRYDAMAQMDAVSSVRKPSDDELKQRARSSVCAADALGDAGRDIVNMIHQHWPKAI